MQADLDRVLFDQATIHRRLDELAVRISDDYRKSELTVIAILNGSLIFMADLLRRIPLPLKLDCLGSPVIAVERNPAASWSFARCRYPMSRAPRAHPG